MKRVLYLLFLVFITSSLSAQWECRSQLSPKLKPLAQSKLYWASEVTLGAGYLTNNAIFNSMGFLGLDYSVKNSVLFAEIGYKYWDRVDFDSKNNFKNGHFGVRELFYQYKGGSSRVTAGIQSATLDDYFLLNERMLGVNYKYNKNAWALNFNGGTVLKGFSRNGLFCSVGYLYDIVQGRDLALIGSKPGETNFAGVSIRYSPSKAKTNKEKNSDEFSLNEFESDFLDNGERMRFQIEDIGLVLYSEFGSLIDNVVYIPGVFIKVEMPANFTFKPEVLYQISNQNNAIIYSLALESNIVTSKNKFSVNTRYIGSYEIDESAKLLNSYSNLFMGDVLRLDSRDALPLLQIGARVSFPSIKTHFKLQYSAAMGRMPLSELNFEYGKRFAKLVQIVAVTGLVNNKQIGQELFFGRVECRISL
ncbi:MAG: hypothetical protein U1D64_03000 [Bacteroidales bacterium]|nr:hypothetical protein [Bacteroidales bacterium]